MMRGKNRSKNADRSLKMAVLTAIGMGAVAGSSLATDNLSIVVSRTDGPGSKSIGAFGYKPDTDGAGPDVEAIYTTGYGQDAITPGNPTIRKIAGLGIGETRIATTVVSEAQQRYFYTDGNPGYSVVGNQGASSFLLNPVAIGSIPAYSQAWTIDGVTVRNGSTAASNLPATSDRFGKYSLNPVTSNADALVQLTSLAPMSAFQDAIQAETGTRPTSTFVPIRQGAWSGDGQSLYHSDSSGDYGGIWKLNPISGAVQRIVTSTRAATITEIAVLPQGGGVDRILFLGKSGDANAGGINYVDYSGTKVTADADVKVFLDKDKLADFLDNTVAGRSGLASPWSINKDTSGTVFFVENNTDTQIALDPQGRLIKVATRDERKAALGDGSTSTTAGSSQLRLQTRTVTLPGGFSATQLLSTDNGTDANLSDAVVGAIHYKPGDFTRDNVVTSDDTSLFLGALQARKNYTAATLPAPSKYDLNGNRTVDWKDVKILQTFLGFKDGDTNLDGSIDFTDLNILRDNYFTLGGSNNKTWATGDFASMSPTATTYLATAADANLVNLVDLQVLADTWLNVLGQPNLTFADLDTYGYGGQFRTDVIATFNVVPEPGTAAMLVIAAGLAMGRRRARRE